MDGRQRQALSGSICRLWLLPPSSQPAASWSVSSVRSNPGRAEGAGNVRVLRRPSCLGGRNDRAAAAARRCVQGLASGAVVPARHLLFRFFWQSESLGWILHDLATADQWRSATSESERRMKPGLTQALGSRAVAQGTGSRHLALSYRGLRSCACQGTDFLVPVLPSADR